jgi:hypothetical protein
MKKIIVAVFFITAITANSFGQNGVIRELTGEVELRLEGAASFVPASVGAAVAPNTIVSTGFRSTAVVVVGSSVITVRPLTRLSLAEIQSAENAENVSVNLQAGRVRVDVRPPAGTRTNLSVQSPSSTASVRGTSFEMDRLNLNVSEGRVILTGNTGSAVIVSAGNASLVKSDGAPANPVEVMAGTLAPSSPVGAPSSDMISMPTEVTSYTTLTPEIIYPGN